MGIIRITNKTKPGKVSPSMLLLMRYGWVLKVLVSANLYNNYLFIPEFSEIDVFVETFEDILIQRADGWTYGTYATVPKSQIKGVEYFGEVAPATRSFDTEQAFLTALGLGLNGVNGNFQNAQLGLALNKSVYVTHSDLGYQSNRIPVLFSFVPTALRPKGIITGFTGDFSFETGLFHGQMQIEDYDQVWSA